MTVFLLDTDTITLLQQGHPVVTTRVRTAVGAVGTTAITVEEQVSGRIAQLRKATQPEDVAVAYRRLAETVHSLGSVPVYTFDVPAIARFDGLVQSKLNVKKNDLRIAAIGLVVGAVVETRNRRDFERVPGLVVQDWSVPAHT